MGRHVCGGVKYLIASCRSQNCGQCLWKHMRVVSLSVGQMVLTHLTVSLQDLIPADVCFFLNQTILPCTSHCRWQSRPFLVSPQIVTQTSHLGPQPEPASLFLHLFWKTAATLLLCFLLNQHVESSLEKLTNHSWGGGRMYSIQSWIELMDILQLLWWLFSCYGLNFSQMTKF